jgi:hypothetical protein
VHVLGARVVQCLGSDNEDSEEDSVSGAWKTVGLCRKGEPQSIQEDESDGKGRHLDVGLGG